MERTELAVPAGLTIAELLALADIKDRLATYAHVWLGDDAIPRENWVRIRPKPGTRLTVRVVPRGGGGKKNPLATVLMIAVIAAAFILPPLIAPMLGTGITASTAIIGGLTVGNLIGGVITIVGSLLVNAIAPPPKPKLADLSGLGERTSPTLSITGAANRSNPYGPIPRVFGRHRLFPPNGAAQFTEIAGNDQYLRVLFDLGYGPLAVSDLRIGTTPIAEFEGIEMELRSGAAADAPITLYSNVVLEDAHAIKLTAAGGAQILETRADADEITADLTFQGLVTFDDDGNRTPRTVQVRIEYRRAGTADAFAAIRDDQSTATSTAVTLLSAPDGAVHADWRTVEPVQGPVAITLPYTELVGSEQTISPHSWTFNVHARAEGDAAFVLREQTSARTVQVVGQSGKRLEIRLEKVATSDPAYSGSVNAGGAPCFPLPVFAYPAIANTDFLSITAASEQVVRRTARIKPAAKARYEVRFTRLTADTTDQKIRDEVFISAVRTIRYTPPITATGHCLLALRVKATNQLQGLIQSFNCVAEAMLPTWTGSAFTAPVLTRNPAWAALSVLRGPANKKPIADSRIDLASWLALAQACDAPAQDGAPAFRFDAVIDFRSTVREMAGDILATCRAALGFKDGQYTVVRDKAQSVPVQAFSPRNSWGFRAVKIWVQRPHGLKARFINPAKDWSQDEVIAYDDGYDATTATLFETMELFGVTRPAQAWREATRRMAESKLRPEVYRLTADIEHVVCRRGDLVAVAHDVPRWGLTQGRLKSFVADGGGNVTQLTLDETMTLEPGKLYAVRVRRNDLALVNASVTTPGVVTETGTIDLATPIPPASAPAVGDLVFFGEAERVTVDLVLKGIRRLRDHAAELELVDAAPDLHQVDLGALPAFDTQSTFPGQGVNLHPEKPRIEEARSDEEAMIELPGGGWQTAIRFTFAQRSSAAVAIDLLEIQSRETGSIVPWDTARHAPNAIVWATGFDDGVTYDLRLRYVTPEGRASDWTMIDGHRVVGKTGLPPDVKLLALSGDHLLWPYPARPRDFGGFRVLYQLGENRQRAGAIDALGGALLSAPPFDTRVLPGGTVTVLVVGVDASGNESAAPAIMIRDLGGPVRANVVESVDYRALVWPGTATNFIVDAGDLAAQEDSDGFWPADDNAPFWPALDSAAFWSGNFKPLTYVASFQPDAQWLPAQTTLDFDIDGLAALQYRTDGGDGFWPSEDATPFWPADDAAPLWPALPDFLPWPGRLAARSQLYEFRVVTAAGPLRGRVKQLKAVTDVEDVEESFQAAAIAAGGTRLALTKPFRAVTDVALTLLADGGTATSARLEDMQLAPGPLVRTLAGGAGVAGTVNATVKGY